MVLEADITMESSRISSISNGKIFGKCVFSRQNGRTSGIRSGSLDTRRSLAAYPPIFPRKNLKTKGLDGRKFHILLYFQDIKFVAASPHFRENSILCGIRWLGGIGKNFCLTQLGVTPLGETERELTV